MEGLWSDNTIQTLLTLPKESFLVAIDKSHKMMAFLKTTIIEGRMKGSFLRMKGLP